MRPSCGFTPGEWRNKDEQVPLEKGLLLLLWCSASGNQNTTNMMHYEKGNMKFNHITETNSTYLCHWWWPHLYFLLSWALVHMWAAYFSAWELCVCSGPSLDTLWTAHAPVFWWGFLHWTTSVFVNGCRGTGGAGGGRNTSDRDKFAKKTKHK